MILDLPPNPKPITFTMYNIHGQVRQTIHMASRQRSLRVFVARRSYALLPLVAALALPSASQHPQQVTTSQHRVPMPVVTTCPPLPPKQNPTDVAPHCSGAKYFRNRGHNLSAPFLAFYLKYGQGIFGVPRTEAFCSREPGPVFRYPTPPGSTSCPGQMLMQYTDRFLLELVHGRVQVGDLGRLLTRKRKEPQFKPEARSACSCAQCLAGTSHCVAGRFLATWRKYRDLLGSPIADPTIEQNADGSHRTYVVQWFENGRVELHPENAGKYQVELGLLGRQYLKQLGWLKKPKNE